MKIKDLTKEELENMSYDDLAYMILKEAGKKMKITDLFAKVCKILELDDSVFESQIADFFQLLSTEKRFLQLENGYWDLKENHSQKVVIDDEDDEVFIESDEEDEEIEEDDDDIFDENSSDDDDIMEDDLKDLAVINPDDEENENIE